MITTTKKIYKIIIVFLLLASMSITNIKAVENSSSKAYLLGDSDCDSDVTILDATIIQVYIAKIKELSNLGCTLSEVNGDKIISIIDATLIQQYLAGVAKMDWIDVIPEWVGSAYAQRDSNYKIEIMSEKHGVGEEFSYAKIPVSEGQRFYIDGTHYYHSFCYALSNTDNIVLHWDSHSDKEVNAVKTEITVQENESYLYFNSKKFTCLKKQVITHLDEEVSLLMGKKIVYDGDSICLGAFAKGGYPKIISDITGCQFENFAHGGATLTSASETGKHSVVDNLSNLPTDGDIYCFQGGINDYWKQRKLGSYDENDFTGELDISTVCGAMEEIFRYLNGKKICFIITHKVQKTAIKQNENGDTFLDYRNAMIGICEKYSVAYYDAFELSGLDGSNQDMSEMYLTGNENGVADGCHPNKQCYEIYYVPQLIDIFENII